MRDSTLPPGDGDAVMVGTAWEGARDLKTGFKSST